MKNAIRMHICYMTTLKLITDKIDTWGNHFLEAFKIKREQCERQRLFSFQVNLLMTSLGKRLCKIKRLSLHQYFLSIKCAIALFLALSSEYCQLIDLDVSSTNLTKDLYQC